MRADLLPLAVLIVIAGFVPARADMWTYTDEDGKEVKVEARLAGSGQGTHALELDDGQYRLVPQSSVTERIPGDGPTPATPDEMIRRLTEKFGADVFRAEYEKPFVVGLVLTSPMPKSSDVRVRGFLKKAAKFLRTVESVFLDFAKTARIPTEPPRFPLVVLIFETDSDFEKFAEESTGGRGISAGNISGFYSGLSNWLAIRLSECHTFEVPLHEAIHQQTFNRGVFNRLAPTPKWFSEGIATGFEGNGERIDIGPFKINSNYARRALEGTSFDWDEVITNDRAFGADILAGDAYTHAWCLHWMLCTKHKEQYTKYVQALSQRQTLELVTAEDRKKDFEDAFGKEPAQLQKDFRVALELGIKRQKLNVAKASRPGISRTQSNLGEVELTAVRHVDQGGALEVKGLLRNLSPLRAMSFLVTVETDSGLYADWHVSSLEMKRTAPLKQQWATKLMTRAPGGPARTFRVRIRSVAPDSPAAAEWDSGNLPVPEYRPAEESDE